MGIFCTFFVEEFTRVFASKSDVLRDGTEEFDDVGQMILIARIILARMRFEQIVASRQLKSLRDKECEINNVAHARKG